jgi:hypothetical protein
MRPTPASSVLLALVECLAVAGCADQGGPACRDSDCVVPPEDACVDAQTLREYDAQGSCDPDAAACEYGHTDRRCEARCAQGRCVSGDPCAGVLCDEPPTNQCQDGSRLRVFDAQGECDPARGACDYPWNDRTCETACLGDRCVGEDPCAGVTCDSPPPARCADDLDLAEYAPIGTCDLQTGRCEYPRSLRACPEGCVLDFCLDLGDDFALVIPAGTRACSDKRSTWDLLGGYQTRMRIAFREGVVRLPRDESGFERDWIEAIELGPGRDLLQPLTAGTFSRTASAGQVEYRFDQLFSGAGETYTLEFVVWFDEAQGAARVRTFDEAFLSPPMAYPSASLDLRVESSAGQTWYLLTCRYDLYLPVLHRVRTADGAELDLEERSFPSDACMLACPTALARATFRLGQDQRQVDDPFRLAFVDGQHNWFDQFLVVFEDPVSDIHALSYFPADQDVPEECVEYLDAQLEQVGSSPVTSHLTVELWPTFDAGTVSVTTCAGYCDQYVGLAEGCEASCPMAGQELAGRCLSDGGWPPSDDWTALAGCDEDFSACAQAGRGYVQCCCSRIAGDW